MALKKSILGNINGDMHNIEDIKNSLNSRTDLSVLTESMYMPTEEKLTDLINKYINNHNIIVYGYIGDKNLEGIIALDTTDIGNIIILNIAVNKYIRFKGIGSRLIDYTITNLKPKALIAETDDDAVGFYEKYGFEIRNLCKIYGDINRYECKYIC